MFTPEERARLRSELLTRVSADGRISGAAITGSGAAEREDRWSDIDLTFGVGEGAEMPDVLSDWTTHMYARHGAVHHVDMKAGAWIYRVFLLASTLQVDLGVRARRGIPGAGGNFPPRLREGRRAAAVSAATAGRYHRHGLAVCAACAELYRPAETLAGRIHDQRSSRPCAHASLPAPRTSGGLWPRIRSTAGCGHGRIPRLFRAATRCKGADSCLPDGYGRAAPGNPAQ